MNVVGAPFIASMRDGHTSNDTGSDANDVPKQLALLLHAHTCTHTRTHIHTNRQQRIRMCTGVTYVCPSVMQRSRNASSRTRASLSGNSPNLVVSSVTSEMKTPPPVVESA